MPIRGEISSSGVWQFKPMKKPKADRHGEKGVECSYIPTYVRTNVTDALHNAAGFRPDYKIIPDELKEAVLQRKQLPCPINLNHPHAFSYSFRYSFAERSQP